MYVEPITIACIVEGHGEVPGLPKLLYRIADQFSVRNLRVPIPYRIPRGSLVAAGGIERVVDAQARRVNTAGGVLVLLDADDDCPALLGPSLLSRAQAARSDKLVSVVLPKREFEGWFLAAAASLGGRCGLPDNLVAPQEPERIRDAKGWLTRRRTDGLSYQPTADQAVLGSVFDMGQARIAAPSFDKFCRDVEKLLGVESTLTMPEDVEIDPTEPSTKLAAALNVGPECLVERLEADCRHRRRGAERESLRRPRGQDSCPPTRDTRSTRGLGQVRILHGREIHARHRPHPVGAATNMSPGDPPSAGSGSQTGSQRRQTSSDIVRRPEMIGAGR